MAGSAQLHQKVRNICISRIDPAYQDVLPHGRARLLAIGRRAAVVRHHAVEAQQRCDVHQVVVVNLGCALDSA